MEEEEEEEEDLWTRMMTTPDAGLVNTEERRGDQLSTQVYEELVYLSLSFNRRVGLDGGYDIRNPSMFFQTTKVICWHTSKSRPHTPQTFLTNPLSPLETELA